MSAPVERRDVHGRMLARERGKISALLPVTRRGLDTSYPAARARPDPHHHLYHMDTDTAAATPPRWAYGPRLRRLTALIDSACHQSLRLPTSANIMSIFSRRRVLYGYRPTRPPAGAALARRRQRCDDAPLLTGCDPGPQFLHWMASPGHRSAGAAHALLNARLSALGRNRLATVRQVQRPLALRRQYAQASSTARNRAQSWRANFKFRTRLACENVAPALYTASSILRTLSRSTSCRSGSFRITPD